MIGIGINSTSLIGIDRQRALIGGDLIYHNLYFLCLAMVDLGPGESCDEINERKYCDKGLVCLRNEGDTDYSCV